MTDMRRLSLKATAFHEAGHAVSAVLNRISFSRVWLLRRQDSDPVPQNVPLGQLTRTTPVNKPDFAGKLLEAKVEAVQALSGPIAECLPYPGMLPDWDLNGGDVFDAGSFLRFALVPFSIIDRKPRFDQVKHDQAHHELDRLLNECLQTAAKLVHDNQTAITNVAEALLARWELTADEAASLL